MNSADLDAQTVARALEDFFQAMDLRTERNVRVAKRVTSMLRVGMASIALFAALMAIMIWVFTDRIREITGVLATMHGEFTQMSENMSDMRSIITTMEQDMASFAVVTDQMRSMRTTISGMNDNVGLMAGRMDVMNTDVNLITTSVTHMGQSFRLLSPAVSDIGTSVGRGAAPMNTFNNFFPFSRMLP